MNILDTIDRMAEKTPLMEHEYIDKEGQKRCSVCQDKTETVIQILGVTRTVRAVCSCYKAELASRKEYERLQEQETRRKICFPEAEMKEWTFQGDDRKNPKLSDAMQNYAEQFDNFSKDGVGLLLYGTVGTGKTYYAACIANQLIDNGKSVLMTNFARLTNKLQGMREGKQEFLDSLNRYSLLIIDDLGAERETGYMREMVFNIVDSRYRTGKPLIVTTNLTAEEIKNPKDIECARIYDRILEKCTPIEMRGSSRRKQNMKANYAERMRALGL